MQWKGILPTVLAGIILGTIGFLARKEFNANKILTNTNKATNAIILEQLSANISSTVSIRHELNAVKTTCSNLLNIIGLLEEHHVVIDNPKPSVPKRVLDTVLLTSLRGKTISATNTLYLDIPDMAMLQCTPVDIPVGNSIVEINADIQQAIQTKALEY